MVLVTMRPTRGAGDTRGILRSFALYTGSGVAAAGVVGASLGASGRLVTPPTRTVAWIAGVVVLSAFGVTHARRGRPHLIQRSAETPHRWLALPPAASIAANGAAIGSGFVTRIGFWIWYLVPLSAFVSGSATVGFIIYSCYGAARTTALAALIRHAKRGTVGSISHRLLLAEDSARTLAGRVGVLLTSMAIMVVFT